MSNKPKDTKLYIYVKKKIYLKYPKHSAYRSGILVKEYKKMYKKKYNNEDSYIGVKENKKGLARWFKEKWKNDDGKIGYTKKNSVYRPTKRITQKTPLTFGELTKKEIINAKKEKEKKGRVKKFRINKKMI